MTIASPERAGAHVSYRTRGGNIPHDAVSPAMCGARSDMLASKIDLTWSSMAFERQLVAAVQVDEGQQARGGSSPAIDEDARQSPGADGHSPGGHGYKALLAKVS